MKKNIETSVNEMGKHAGKMTCEIASKYFTQNINKISEVVSRNYLHGVNLYSYFVNVNEQKELTEPLKKYCRQIYSHVDMDGYNNVLMVMENGLFDLKFAF